MSMPMGSEPLGRTEGDHIATEIVELAFVVQAHTVVYYRLSTMHDACGIKPECTGPERPTAPAAITDVPLQFPLIVLSVYYQHSTGYGRNWPSYPEV